MVTYFGTNATGWLQLNAGNMTTAVYTMYSEVWSGWFVTLLFLLFQFSLYIKTKNLNLCFITGSLFMSVYGTATNLLGSYPVFNSLSMWVIYLVLIMEFGGLVYYWLGK